MSFAVSAALQVAIYQRLIGDPGVIAQLGDAIYDTLPAGTLPGMYLLLGPEEVRDRSDVTGHAAEHRVTLSLRAQAAGFHAAKQAAGAVCDALQGAELTLTRGRLVGLWFDRARTQRAGRVGDIRQIDLRFRAQVEDD
ncbi:MAG: DUF3168 domain-containing protein [Marinibacterium sp.]|nr:DUF3168 domain-containing protein [Marinibacterium sp.]